MQQTFAEKSILQSNRCQNKNLCEKILHTVDRERLKMFSIFFEM